MKEKLKDLELEPSSRYRKDNMEENTNINMQKAIKNSMREIASKAMYNNLIWWATGEKKYSSYELERAFTVIDSIFLKEYRNEFLVTIPKDTIFYRARRIDENAYGSEKNGLHYDKDRFYGFNWEESKEPPTAIAPDGRVSYKGEVALYLAAEEITACVEVRPQIRQLVSVARFKLTQDIQVLDLSKLKYSVPLDSYDEKYDTDVRHLLSNVLGLFTRPVYGSNYIVTQKIVEHYRFKGIKGFAYRSFYTNGTNYTFFDEYMKLFVWEDSRVLINYATSNYFLSLDKVDQNVDINNVYMTNIKLSEKNKEDLIHNTQELFSTRD